MNNSSIAIDRKAPRASEKRSANSVQRRRAIEKRSIDEVSHHVKRSAEMAGQLAIAAGCDHEQAQALKQAASVYDIGKVSVQLELAQRADALSIHDYEEIVKVIQGLIICSKQILQWLK